MHRVPQIVPSVCRASGDRLHGMLAGDELDNGGRIVSGVLPAGHFQRDRIPTFQPVPVLYAVPAGLRPMRRFGSLHRVFGRT